MIVHPDRLAGRCSFGVGRRSLDPILKRGALVVGLTGKQSLMNALSRKGKLIGLDVELAQARFIPG